MNIKCSIYTFTLFYYDAKVTLFNIISKEYSLKLHKTSVECAFLRKKACFCAVLCIYHIKYTRAKKTTNKFAI